jgi:NADPH:quinone reductase-like Zn-dependent oxidoreductase
MASGDRRNIVKAARQVARMPRFNPLRLMSQSKAVIGLNLLTLWDDRGSLEEVTGPLTGLVEQGAIHPIVAEAFPFDRVADAHRFIQDRKNIGKVVLTW